jgi:monofunctional glycosyltransferase
VSGRPSRKRPSGPRRPRKGSVQRKKKRARRQGASGGKVRRLVVRTALALLLFAVALPPLQVASLRLIPPPLTGTRVQRALGGLGDGGLRQQHDWRSLEQISPDLLQAVLVAEDQRFWVHRGFDLQEVEAAVADHREGKGLRGASTLTMQTARTVFLWQGGGWGRKGLEAWYTLWMEWLLPKERILEVYLNEAEWGPGVFGAEAAARHHFGVGVDALTPGQACALAATLPGPFTRDPCNPSRSMQHKIDWIQPQLGYPLPRPDAAE